ncbi:hypothetical protein [Deinococcus yavapaiensis]|uniref:Uncharacterized protein n=1 Tax=Deinococcus yavapaiensis KR-236 TaxID=694435 RepID=A0A318S6S7_9DEIO|nr:hypothetical protein [Deinococcus yavapaiensis]PYE50540.1 hypothetical protein DES52_11758 [Deinococcus yavapaiensis KR-236]
MKRAVWLGVALSATVGAVTLKPAAIISADIEQSRSKGDVETHHYVTVQNAFPKVDVFTVKGVPNNVFFIQKCREAVRNKLKAPATAKFSAALPTMYFVYAGTYRNFGKVDAQNSLGAPSRSSYMCLSVFEGTQKGGRVYIKATLLN